MSLFSYPDWTSIFYFRKKFTRSGFAFFFLNDSIYIVIPIISISFYLCEKTTTYTGLLKLAAYAFTVSTVSSKE